MILIDTIQRWMQERATAAAITATRAAIAAAEIEKQRHLRLMENSIQRILARFRR